MIDTQRLARLGAITFLVAATARGAAAQVAPPNTTCAGQKITAVTVLALPPLENPSTDWWETPVRVINNTHVVTKPSVVTSLMLLKPGDACDRFLLKESERILRAQPFIADAHIAVVPDSGGTVLLVVSTQDEYSFIIATRLSGQSPFVTALTVGDGNINGSGMSIAGNWTHTTSREGFGIAYTNYAFLQHPWQLQFAAGRGEIGQASYLGDLSHPFYSDAQSNAWRGSFADVTLVQPFQRVDTSSFNMAQHRQFFFAGDAVRLGKPGAVLLLGGALSTEFDQSGIPFTGYDSTVAYDSLLMRYVARRSVRLNLIAQLRGIRFERATRLGTVNGYQDLRTGFEFDLLVGRGFGNIDGSQADLFLSGKLFAGGGGGRTYAFVQANMESRRGGENGNWSDALASGVATLYQRFGQINTLIANAEFGGGWQTTRPFELDLGQPEGGVRGYGASHDAGGERVALKLEDRWFLGSMMDRADIGLAVFVDAGKVYAGDIPFGTTTPIKVGVGVGLLVASPVGSRRTYRVDFAVPVSPDTYARWEFRLTVTNIAQLGAFHEPLDMAFGRELVSTSTSLTYPR
jgi:hypothetical protein